MADFLVTDLRDDALQELNDVNQRKFLDPEFAVYMNQAIRFVKRKIKQLNLYATISEEFGKHTISYAEFSSGYKHNLPLDYLEPVLVKRDGFDDPIRIVTVNQIDDTTTTNYGVVYGASVGAPVPVSTNTSPGGFATQGNFTGTTNTVYAVKTEAAGTTFAWSNDGGSTYPNTGVTITGDWQTLENGVQVKFGDTEGYILDDQWDFTAYNTQLIQILELNWAPEENIVVWYSKRPTKVTTSGDPAVLSATQYLPFYRYYDALLLFVIIKCRNAAEETVAQDAALYAPVVEVIMNTASYINGDTGLNMSPTVTSKDAI